MGAGAKIHNQNSCYWGWRWASGCVGARCRKAGWPGNLCPEIYARYSMPGILCPVFFDGVVSPLNRSVQLPVNTCVKRDSLQFVQLGAGSPCWSRHIAAKDSAATSASNIHMVRFITSSLTIYHSVIWSGRSSSSTSDSGKIRPATEWPARRGLSLSPVTSGCHSGRSLPSNNNRYAQVDGIHANLCRLSAVSITQSGTTDLRWL